MHVQQLYLCQTLQLSAIVMFVMHHLFDDSLGNVEIQYCVPTSVKCECRETADHQPDYQSRVQALFEPP